MRRSRFDPDEFLSLAAELCAESRGWSLDDCPVEASVRTAYGRAYYGLYLTVRSAIVQRHGFRHGAIKHGALYTYLQNSRLSDDLRDLGRHLQHLYSLRRTADYELAPGRVWEEKLRDADAAFAMAGETDRLSRVARHLDFTPIAQLF